MQRVEFFLVLKWFSCRFWYISWVGFWRSEEVRYPKDPRVRIKVMFDLWL